MGTKCLALFIHAQVHAAGTDFLHRQELPRKLRLRAAQEVPRIAACLKEWRALDMVLVGMQSVWVHVEGEGCEKRRKLGAGRCALGMLDTGDAVLARQVGSYFGTPGCFVGVPALRVVDVYQHIVATTPKWSE